MNLTAGNNIGPWIKFQEPLVRRGKGQDSTAFPFQSRYKDDACGPLSSYYMYSVGSAIPHSHLQYFEMHSSQAIHGHGLFVGQCLSA